MVIAVPPVKTSILLSLHIIIVLAWKKLYIFSAIICHISDLIIYITDDLKNMKFDSKNSCFFPVKNSKIKVTKQKGFTNVKRYDMLSEITL